MFEAQAYCFKHLTPYSIEAAEKCPDVGQVEPL